MWVYLTAPIGAFVVILGEIVTWIDFDEKEQMKEKILKYYKEWGYIPTIEYLRELSLNGKIVLTERSKLQSMITELEVKPKRNKRR